MYMLTWQYKHVALLASQLAFSSALDDRGQRGRERKLGYLSQCAGEMAFFLIRNYILRLCLFIMFLKIFFELLLNQPLRNLFAWMPAAWDICCSWKRSLLCFCRLKPSLLVHNSPVLQLSSPEISPSCSSRSSSLCRCMEVINEFHLEDEHSAEAELFSLNISLNTNVAFSRPFPAEDGFTRRHFDHYLSVSVHEKSLQKVLYSTWAVQ